MNVGIPGTGLGGFFYALSVLAMLLIELVRFLVGRGERRRLVLVLRQSTLLIGIIGAIVTTDIFLEKIVLTSMGGETRFLSGDLTNQIAGADAFAWSTLLLASGLIALIYLVIHGLRIFLLGREYIQRFFLST